MANATKLKEFASLKHELDDLDAKTKAAQARYNKLEAELREQFIDEGMQNANIDGVTIYLSTEIWAGAEKGADGETDWPAACAALEAAGYGEVVGPRFNVATVSGLVRELPRDPETELPILPPEMVGHIRVTTKTQLKTMKSAGKGKNNKARNTAPQEQGATNSDES